MNKKIFIYCVSLILIISFFLYALLVPSSQIFWKTVTQSTTGEVLYTFDDGPGEQTPAILNILNEHNVSAVFFVNCAHINSSENEILIRIVQEGHSIGIHGYDHRLNEGYDELNSCKKLIENITGKRVTYFRPPYGIKLPKTMQAAKELNMTIMMWSNFPRDYSAKSSDQIVRRINRHIDNTSIICLHDGPMNRENTADAVNYILLKN